MVPGECALVQRVRFTNTASVPKPLDIAFRMSGRCVNRGIKDWFWAVPTVSTQVADLHHSSGLNPKVEINDGRGKLFTYPDQAKSGAASDGPHHNACCYQVLNPTPERWLRNGDAGYIFACDAGESVVLDLALVMGSDPQITVALGDSLVTGVEDLIAKAEADWRQTWNDVFIPGNPTFSGHLENLDLPEDLVPVAVSAVMGLLAHRRTLGVLEGVAYYNILTPRRCETGFYNWDFCLASPTLARLDPDAVWRQLAMVWQQDDWRKYNQYNFMTGEGAGWPYRADTFNLFFAHWNLWEASGRSPDLLARTFDTQDGRRTFLSCLEELAIDYRKDVDGASGLADFGGKEGLLECVTTYEHQVASLNAGAVWCLERLAELRDSNGHTSDAAALRAEATHLAAAVKELYVEGHGFFQCRQPDGSRRDVRMAYDVAMVLYAMGERLSLEQQQEIVDFFQRELQTPGWLRQLSPQDGDAAVSGTRADHQFCGAYAAWPALFSLGLLKIGRSDIVGDWLNGIARTAMQGPFGQGHWDESMVPPTAGGATKVTDELPHGTHWSDISGALFYEVMRQYRDVAR